VPRTAPPLPGRRQVSLDRKGDTVFFLPFSGCLGSRPMLACQSCTRLQCGADVYMWAPCVGPKAAGDAVLTYLFGYGSLICANSRAKSGLASCPWTLPPCTIPLPLPTHVPLFLSSTLCGCNIVELITIMQPMNLCMAPLQHRRRGVCTDAWRCLAIGSSGEAFPVIVRGIQRRWGAQVRICNLVFLSS
jgi:hypothetical protein